MNRKELMLKVTRAIGSVKMELIEHAPDILLVAGLGCIVGGTVLCCIETRKIDPVIEDFYKMREDAKDLKEDVDADIDRCSDIDGHKCTEDEAAVNLMQVYWRTGKGFVKTYWKGATLELVGIGMVVLSEKLLHDKIDGLLAAYIALDKSYKALDNKFTAYRKQVAGEIGEEKEQEMYDRFEAELDRGGDVEGILDNVKFGDYARFYQAGCNGWTKDPEMNLLRLRQYQNILSDKLHAQGYLLLNEVYEVLGYKPTKAGMVVGWYLGGVGYVDFGLDNIDSEAKARFINCDEPNVLLTFNVDGVIVGRFED